tara:strand:+ start:184 stop:1080 length:897 start_codon:yes stop_codon:yes gene_type:complete
MKSFLRFLSCLLFISFSLLANEKDVYINLPFKNPTKEMLLKMEKKVHHLPTVKNPGEMESFQHYLGAIDLIMLASQETPNCREFIKKYIFSDLPRFGTIIDVGTGSGENTNFIAQKFEDVTLIDPEKKALDSLGFTDLQDCKQLTKIKATFQKSNLSNKKADLIVFAHVFYEIPQDEWISVIKKAYKSLVPGGIIFIVFNQGGSRDNFIHHFKPSHKFSFHTFQRNLKTIFPSSEIFISREHIQTKSLEAMLQLCNLFLFDSKVKIVKEDLTHYIHKYFQENDGFKASMDQVFIKIKK